MAARPSYAARLLAEASVAAISGYRAPAVLERLGSTRSTISVGPPHAGCSATQAMKRTAIRRTRMASSLSHRVRLDHREGGAPRYVMPVEVSFQI